MGLIAIDGEFPTEEECQQLLERLRWPNGVRCVSPSFCRSPRISKFTAQLSARRVRRASGDEAEVTVPERRLYECMECGYQFSATTGTLFHKAHLPLRKWFFAIAVTLNAKQPITTRQMKLDLNVSQKTAWLLNRRLRDTLTELLPETPDSDGRESL